MSEPLPDPPTAPTGSRFAQWLRMMRAARGVTQEQAAVEIGINVLTLGRYERGDRSPTRDTLRKLADWGNLRFRKGGNMAPNGVTAGRLMDLVDAPALDVGGLMGVFGARLTA